MNVTYDRPPEHDGALIARLDGTLNALTADELWEAIASRFQWS